MMQISDLLMERSKLLKHQTYWKIALVLAIGVIIYFVYHKTQTHIAIPAKHLGYIGSIRIESEIFEDHKFDKLLDDIEKDKSIKALIVQINSPGGSSGASEKIYNKLLTIKKTRPVVVTMGTIATSGAYIIALAADRIFALNMTLTGSIGVIIQSAEVIDLAAKLGIKLKNYKSAPLKAMPNPFEPATPEAEEALMEVIKDSYQYFVEIVALNRKLDISAARKLADGRIYSGRQALQLHLIDEIGTNENAIEWLKDKKGIDPNLTVKEIEPKKHNEFLDMVINKFDESSKSFIQKISTKLMSIYR